MRFVVVQRGIGFEELDRQVTAPLQELLDERLELWDKGVGAFGRKVFHMSSLRIVFVTGLSGAGLSQAIKSFEDLGFYCIEHLPPVVLDATIDALERSAARDVAVALDLRSDATLGDPGSAIDRVARTHQTHVLFLDAADDLLVRRFSETRRRHPFSATGSVHEAIDADRRALAPLRERADVVIDTTNLTPGALKERIAGAFLADLPARLTMTFVSFGFKFGLPTDLDLLFDVRFLRNPNYEEALAPQTGEDGAVGAFIEDDSSLAPFLTKVIDLIGYLLPRYLAEGKTQLTVGIGCTGGRHRSVYVARRLMAHFAGDARLDVAFEARDLTRAP
jgi:RNase adapter protein RapZ